MSLRIFTTATCSRDLDIECLIEGNRYTRNLLAFELGCDRKNIERILERQSRI